MIWFQIEYQNDLIMFRWTENDWEKLWKILGTTLVTKSYGSFQV